MDWCNRKSYSESFLVGELPTKILIEQDILFTTFRLWLESHTRLKFYWLELYI